MADKKVVVKLNDEKPEPVEIIAKSIIEIAVAMEKIQKSMLTRRAIVCLIKDQSGLPARDINLVLNCLDDLKKDFIKVNPKK